MLCDICHKNQATIFLDQTQNNEHRHLRLCMDCARKNGIITDDFKISLFPQNFLKQFYTPKKIYPKTKAKKVKKFYLVECPHCHTTLEEFKKNDQVGCAYCWDIFAFSLIGKDYEVIHYDGKTAKSVSKSQVNPNKSIEDANMKLKHLQLALQALVKKEKYEEAIKIRETIKIIKKQAHLCN